MTDPRIPSPERQSDLFRISVQDEAAGFFVLPQAIAWALAERERADRAETERDAALRWEDVDDEWTVAADAAFPTRSGSHEEYGIAMQMVGNRHSKGSLVELVNWLLVERGKLAKWIMACAPHAQSNLSCKQCEPVVGMFVVDGFECGWHLAQRIEKGGT